MAEIVTNVTAAQVRHANLGFRSQSVAKVVPQNATQTVFTISGGRIMVAYLYSVVTTVIAGTTPAAKWVATPTTGTANDACATGTITSAEVGSHFILPLLKATALIVSTATSGSGNSPGVGVNGMIIAPGTLGFNVSAADATGACTHSLYYIPLDDATRVVAS
jgi:hypothetical protein